MLKIKKINRIDNTWIDLLNPVPIMTVNGIKMCKRAYINGVREVFKIKTSDEHEIILTGNHRLMSINGEWLS